MFRASLPAFVSVLLVAGASQAVGDVIFVPDDYPTIQEAIDAAGDGDEVIVRPGTYLETIDFLDKDITVRSTDPSDPEIVSTTIINGNRSGTVVVLSRGTIRGFTINHGLAEFYGGGIFATGEAQIRDNVITRNEPTGIWADGDVLINGNQIVANTGSGVYALTRTVLTRNIVRKNQGAGVVAWHNCVILGNIVVGNNASNGAGVYVKHNVAVRSNLISGNRARNSGGGIYADEHAGSIISNTVIGNVGGSGSGIYADGGIVSSNIVAFSPSTNEALLVGGYSTYIDFNCIFGNAGPAYGGNSEFGPNNIELDPRFIRMATGTWSRSPIFNQSSFTTILTDSSASFPDDALFGKLVNPYLDQELRFAIIANTETSLTVLGDASGLAQIGDRYRVYDFHLDSERRSPCISTGDPTQPIEFYLGQDIDREPRVQACNPDIGADEASGTTTTVLVIESTMTTPTIGISRADCNDNADGIGSFNRFYFDAPTVTLTAETTGEIPFRWIVNGEDFPRGQFEVTVDLSDPVSAFAEYSPVVNVTRGTFFVKIQDAISSFGTRDGDEIVVAPSLYIENIDFLDKALTLSSVDPEDPGIVASTIIDGNNQGTVVRLNGGGLHGFTIQHGSESLGGGVLATGGSVVTHNTIRYNWASNRGAGVLASGSLISKNLITLNDGLADGSGVSAGYGAVISDNEIFGNTTTDSGGGVQAQENAIVRNNLIWNNTARSGGGVFAEDDSVIEANTIRGNIATNRGGGVYARGQSEIINNLITGNESHDGENGGGGIYAFGTGLIRDNAIVGNTSQGPGGGVHLGFGPDLLGNTIVGNSCQTQGGGIFVTSIHEQVTLLQNVVAFNEGGYGIYIEEEPFTLDYNCVFGHDRGDYGGLALPGRHDLNVDPRLALDGFHLLADSPCINAGDPAFIPFEGQTDIDGDARVLNLRIDIGADESVCPDIRRLKATCRPDSFRVKATVRSDLPEGTTLTLVLDDAEPKIATVNARGRAKTKWKNITPGDHEVCMGACGLCKPVTCR